MRLLPTKFHRLYCRRYPTFHVIGSHILTIPNTRHIRQELRYWVSQQTTKLQDFKPTNPQRLAHCAQPSKGKQS
ncbi:hypothetical protein VTJ04DRAFT_344 [Mycothermus thermophilus]|uniref:uncharacterized protein n=1 Tax=Humicola insolens TaxID=85995 RepID=UPI003744AB75